ncbi:hypothetical protein EJ05DRAFT_528544 [Pseudovirgaria hyperparasitica]|uniref:Uncharacterized protein n=1 Tax=Pseudovirgaria hyperparasitica TaxID=470096 RepID=A0A6A6W634_9PEZI|nr:uncharacterized protein EJ05DRAFT_528544 [Pseudovirgaria hyperparasitica]KAF2758073.1 hypothetical protein EJ05DRAFT_528544 [Pseudovirgaria hyperparasitica]
MASRNNETELENLGQGRSRSRGDGGLFRPPDAHLLRQRSSSASPRRVSGPKTSRSPSRTVSNPLGLHESSSTVRRSSPAFSPSGRPGNDERRHRPDREEFDVGTGASISLSSSAQHGQRANDGRENQWRISQYSGSRDQRASVSPSPQRSQSRDYYDREGGRRMRQHSGSRAYHGSRGRSRVGRSHQSRHHSASDTHITTPHLDGSRREYTSGYGRQRSSMHAVPRDANSRWSRSPSEDSSDCCGC